jgi:hypothetical protein
MFFGMNNGELVWKVVQGARTPMKPNSACLIALLAVAQFCLGLCARGVTYDVAADFSTISNPNGVWSYGYALTLGGSFNLYNQAGSILGIDYWSLSGDVPDVAHNSTPNPVSLGTPLFAPYQAALHPGVNGEYSIFRFTAPVAGSYLLQTSFSGIDTNGTTTDVHVLTNDAVIFSGSVNGFGPGTGPSFVTNLVLQANDRVDFEVGYGSDGNFFDDATGIQATLILAVPILTVQSLGSLGAQIGWSTNFTGYSLESTTNLPAGAWTSVTNHVTPQGQQFTVTVATTFPQQYFRLRKP